jgi:hypothetical protein
LSFTAHRPCTVGVRDLAGPCRMNFSQEMFLVTASET